MDRISKMVERVAMNRCIEIAKKIAVHVDHPHLQENPWEKLLNEMMDFLKSKHLKILSYGFNKSEYLYHIKFEKQKEIIGNVKISNPDYIQVEWFMEKTFPGVPDHRGLVFSNMANAMKFIELFFVELKFDRAMAVPKI